MGKLIIQNETSTPSIPSTGKSILYIENNQLKSVGYDGVTRVYGTGITPEEVQDIVAGFIVGGSGISVVYDDPNNTLTISSTITQYTDEQAQDAIAAALLSSSTIQFIYDDVNNHITANVIASGIPHQNLSGAGTNTHAQIDSHIASTSNPHATTYTQVGADVAGAAATAQSFSIQRANHTGTQLSSTISDFTEASQDAVGGILTDTTSIDFTYNDAGNQITAAVLPAGVDHNSLSNFVANKHIDHSTVSIASGTGLIGGGDITATRTISLANTTVIANNYGSATQVPVITVDAQGRLTAASNNVIQIPESQVTNLVTDLAGKEVAGAAAAAQAFAIQRANHTGTQLSSTISDFTTAAQAANATALALKADKVTTISAGSGLTGGGDLSTSRTISMPSVGTAGTYGSASNTPVLTTDTQGRISGVTNTPIQITEAQVTNLSTDLSAKVSTTVTISTGTGLTGGGDLTANRTISLANTTVIAGSYGSTSQTPSIAVNAQGQITSATNTNIDHNALTNFVANKHIDHSAVSMIAGTGLTGGGDITATRTIAMSNVGTAGTYGDSTHYPVITTDAQGRVSAVSLHDIVNSQWVDNGATLEWANQTGQDLSIRQATNTGDSPYIRLVKSEGTLVAPLATTIGERLGGIGSYGWNSTGANGLPSSEILGYATENHTATAWGGELQINTVPNGSTVSTLAATFKNNGDLDVVGAIMVGTTTDTSNGNIRYNNNEFQARQNGIWVALAQSPTYLQSTTAVTTTSSTFAAISGMSVTPAAGTYKLDFTCTISNSVTASAANVTVYIAATEQAQCRRTVSNGSAWSVGISTIITVTGSQAVTIQFNRSSGTGIITCSQRELILTPISR